MFSLKAANHELPNVTSRIFECRDWFVLAALYAVGKLNRNTNLKIQLESVHPPVVKLPGDPDFPNWEYCDF